MIFSHPPTNPRLLCSPPEPSKASCASCIRFYHIEDSGEFVVRNVDQICIYQVVPRVREHLQGTRFRSGNFKLRVYVAAPSRCCFGLAGHSPRRCLLARYDRRITCFSQFLFPPAHSCYWCSIVGGHTCHSAPVETSLELGKAPEEPRCTRLPSASPPRLWTKCPSSLPPGKGRASRARQRTTAGTARQNRPAGSRRSSWSYS